MSLRRVLVPLGLAFAGLVGCADVDPDDLLEQTEQALQTFPNEQPAFEYFVGKGLSERQSAGIIGNLDAESGLDPTIRQIGGGPGRGIAQWSAGGRWDTTSGDNVLAYASQRGKDPLTLQLQLDFIWFELTTFPGYGLAALQNTTTIVDAVSVFKAKFEGCPACSTGNRVLYAQSVLDRFGGGSSSSSSSSSGAPAGPACTLDNGDEGECITTSACEARGDHLSSPGLCAGSSEIQCCTAVAAASSSSGANSSGANSSGSSSGSRPKGDAGAGDADRDPRLLNPDEPDFDNAASCATASGSAQRLSALWWLGAGVLVAGRYRRRR